jgi:hypothetical protein
MNYPDQFEPWSKGIDMTFTLEVNSYLSPYSQTSSPLAFSHKAVQKRADIVDNIVSEWLLL